MKLTFSDIQDLMAGFEKMDLLPINVSDALIQMSKDQFAFREQLNAARSIHFHIKVDDADQLPHKSIEKLKGKVENKKEGYVKYAFPHGINFIFSSIPISQEEKLGTASYNFPYLDHIGIDIRDESDASHAIFEEIPHIADSVNLPCKKQGGDGKSVYCCHVQVNEKYWVYQTNNVYWEFAYGKLVVDKDVFGCDLRPSNPLLENKSPDTNCCCQTTQNKDQPSTDSWPFGDH